MQSPAIYSEWICSFVWIFRRNVSFVILRRWIKCPVLNDLFLLDFGGRPKAFAYLKKNVCNIHCIKILGFVAVNTDLVVYLYLLNTSQTNRTEGSKGKTI